MIVNVELLLLPLRAISIGGLLNVDLIAAGVNRVEASSKPEGGVLPARW